MKSPKRVVITGIGIVTAVGTGKAAFQAALRRGQSGCAPISRFESQAYPFHRAHEVRGFDFPNSKTSDRYMEYAFTAAEEAVLDSRADLKTVDPFRIAVSVSSSKGGMETMNDLMSCMDQPWFKSRAANRFESIFPAQAALEIAGKIGARGPVKSWIAACATGNLSVAGAFNLLRHGDADYAVAGASDASIVPMLLAGYRNMKVLSEDRMRPFDQDRSGFLVGEGGAMVFMETLESAQARGAKIYAEVGAVALGQETSHALFYSDEEATLSRTMDLALRRAELSAGDVDYVNLHGTATQHGDIYETREIKKTFGAHAQSLATSAIKPMTGHMLGASGAAEIVATLLAMENKFIPPTLGLDKPDPECDLNYTAKEAAEKKIGAALSVSMGFGGQTAAILLRQP